MDMLKDSSVHHVLQGPTWRRSMVPMARSCVPLPALKVVKFEILEENLSCSYWAF